MIFFFSLEKSGKNRIFLNPQIITADGNTVFDLNPSRFCVLLRATCLFWILLANMDYRITAH